MDYKTKVRRNKIIIVFILSTFVVGCGSLIGFGNFFKSLIFILPFLLLLPIGGYYIIFHFDGQKQFVLFAVWFGFVFAVTAMIGMLLDSRTYPINWYYLFAVVGTIWLLTSIVTLALTPVISAMYRFWMKG